MREVGGRKGQEEAGRENVFEGKEGGLYQNAAMHGWRGEVGRRGEREQSVKVAREGGMLCAHLK